MSRKARYSKALISELWREAMRQYPSDPSTRMEYVASNHRPTKYIRTCY